MSRSTQWADISPFPALDLCGASDDARVEGRISSREVEMRLLKAPTPALVVALIALFVALGGTGYAARSAILSSPTKAQIIKIVKEVAPKLKVAGLAPLPSGKTEWGLFTGGGSNAGWIGLSITYPRPLAAPISDSNIVETAS